ncbi:MAG: response regulator, partial [Candidatus Methylomirabilaceae bacterium]
LERVYAVLEATSDAIALFDLEGRLLLANLTFRKFFGLVPEGLSREDPLRTIDFLTSRAKDAGEFERKFRSLLLHRETADHDTVELAFPYPRTLQRVRAPVRDETERVIGHVHTLRDVTRERETAQFKTEFVSRISHELRTPLTSIKGSLQLLLDGESRLAASDQELLTICLRNTERLTHLINDVLDLSRIEAGKLKLTLADQAIPELVDLAVAAVSNLAAERQIRVELNLSPDLPPVRADRERIVQVLTNLLGNAVKFSATGGSVTVAGRTTRCADSRHGLGTGRASEHVEIGVTDRGRGIAPHDLRRIFLSFHRVDDAATRETSGTGLGLAICKGIVEAHGGKISANSKGLGHGATVTLLLPRSGPRRRHILVAEDDAAFAKMLATILESSELSVTFVAGGRAALEAIAQRTPDLLILDLLLPEIDGWEVLKRLRGTAASRELPILVLTALGVADAERTLALGADEYLSKPISQTVLIETVGRLLADSDRRQEAAEEERAVGGPGDDGGRAPGVTAGRSRPRLLLAEDDAVSLELMVELLAGHGFEVRTCADGIEIMPLARTYRPDLILLDLNLPNIDGLRLARMLRVDPETRGTTIVAVSAYAMPGDEKRMLAAGCDAFIPKPIDTGTFLDTVLAFLDRREISETARRAETLPSSTG